MKYILAAAGLVAIVASTSHAGFAFTSQSRSVSVFASTQTVGEQDSRIAPNFDPFSVGLHVEVADQFGNGFGFASQYSVLEAFHIAANGSWSGGSNYRTGSGGGASRFSVGFTLDLAAPYTLTTGRVGDFFMFNGPAGFSISQGGIYSGDLLPGDYTLQISAAGGAASPPNGDGYDVHLSIVPSPPVTSLLLSFVGMTCVSRRRPPA